MWIIGRFVKIPVAVGMLDYMYVSFLLIGQCVCFYVGVVLIHYYSCIV